MTPRLAALPQDRSRRLMAEAERVTRANVREARKMTQGRDVDRWVVMRLKVSNGEVVGWKGERAHQGSDVDLDDTLVVDD